MWIKKSNIYSQAKKSLVDSIRRAKQLVGFMFPKLSPSLKNELDSNHIVALLQIALTDSQNPLSTLSELTSLDRLSDEQIIKAIHNLYVARHPAAFKIFQELEQNEHILLKQKNVSAWMSLLLQESSGKVLSIGEVKENIKQFQNFQNFARRQFENMTFLALLKGGHLSLTKLFFLESRFFTLSMLPDVHKIGLLRAALKDGPDVYLEIRSKLHLSSLEILKVHELDVTAGHASPQSHSQLVNAFLDCTPNGVQADISRAVKPAYRQLSDQMEFIDVRVNLQQRHRLLDTIFQHIEQQKGFSLIRLGDGESYAWQQNYNGDSSSDIKLRERHWWGVELPQDLRQKISERLLTAISHADVIGIPSIYRLIRDTTSQTPNMQSNAQARGVLCVLENIGSNIKHNTTFTEDRVHQVVFDVKAIHKLSRVANRIIFVSSVQPETIANIMCDISDGTPIEIIEVPTHKKTTANDLFVEGAKPLPYVYESIIDRIDKASQPGDLVLVAAGVIGKIFIDTARRNNAVALDLGSVVDYWAGARTRSVADV
ncbi:MAG: hypothetical protein ACRBCJ_12485 [Hyphomicrobiaceae bacterium]